MNHVVHEAVSAFEEMNFFGEMILGAAAAARRVERIVARASRRRRAVAPSEHDFDFFVLGVVSFSRRFLGYVERAAQEGRVADKDAEGTAPRDLLL
jgi:hypothetical protein